MKANKKCRVCDVELTDENWNPSSRKNHANICKECERKRHRKWREANTEKVKATHTKANRRQGIRSFKENIECTMFLGVHIAERVLSMAFKDVKRMPIRNPGYDFICNHDKLIEIKSSCRHKNGQWSFNVKRNVTADYFLFLAFDNRKDLNPLHAWLIPGSVVNHLRMATVRKGTIHKWDEYALDISKISDCCDAMR